MPALLRHPSFEPHGSRRGGAQACGQDHRRPGEHARRAARASCGRQRSHPHPRPAAHQRALRGHQRGRRPRQGALRRAARGVRQHGQLRAGRAADGGCRQGGRRLRDHHLREPAHGAPCVRLGGGHLDSRVPRRARGRRLAHLAAGGQGAALACRPCAIPLHPAGKPLQRAVPRGLHRAVPRGGLLSQHHARSHRQPVGILRHRPRRRHPPAHQGGPEVQAPHVRHAQAACGHPSLRG